MNQFVWPQNRKSLNYSIACTAVLITLSIIFTRMFSVMLFQNSLRLSIGTVPIAFCGYLFGPVFGAICGALSDLIGIALMPQGVPHYGITITSALYGVIPGILIIIFKKLSIPVIVLNSIISTIFLSALLQTYWLVTLIKTPYDKLLLIRLPGVAFNGALLLVLTLIMYPTLKRLKDRVIINTSPFRGNINNDTK